MKNHLFVLSIAFSLVGPVLHAEDPPKASGDMFDAIGCSVPDMATALTDCYQDVYQAGAATTRVSYLLPFPISAQHRQELLAQIREQKNLNPAIKQTVLALFAEQEGNLKEALAAIDAAPSNDPVLKMHKLRLRWKMKDDDIAKNLANECAEIAVTKDGGVPTPIYQKSLYAAIEPDLARGNTAEMEKFLAFFQDSQSDLRIQLPVFRLRVALAERLGTLPQLLQATKEPALCDFICGDSDNPENARAIQRLLEKAAASAKKSAASHQEAPRKATEDDEQIKNRLFRDGRTLLGIEAPIQSELEELAARPMYIGGTKNPVSRDWQSPGDQSDLTACALHQLSQLGQVAKARAILYAHKEFATLPVTDQLRYLMAASLDVDVIEKIKSLDYSKPEADMAISMLLAYFQERRRFCLIPQSAWVALKEIYATAVAGSGEKSADRIKKDQRLGSLLVDAGLFGREELAILDKTLLVNKPGVQSNALQAFGGNKAPAGLICLLYVTPFGLPILQEPFTPVLGLLHGDYWLTSNNMMGNFHNWSSRYNQEFLLNALAAKSFNQSPDAVEILTRLRKLLPKDSPNALAYDLQVANVPTGRESICNDGDVSAQCKQRLDKILTTPQTDPECALVAYFSRKQQQRPTKEVVAALDAIPTVMSKYTREMLSRELTQGVLPEQLANDPTLDNAIKRFLRKRPPATPDAEQTVAPAEKTLPDGPAQGQAPKPPPVTAKPAPAVLAHDDDKDYARLHAYLLSGKKIPKEALDDARDVLWFQIARDRPELHSSGNSAVKLLCGAEVFDQFLTEIQEKLKRENASELTILRALRLVHGYSIIHNHGERQTYSLRLYALDPKNPLYAGEVISHAVKNRDKVMTMNCLEAMVQNQDLVQAMHTVSYQEMRQLLSAPEDVRKLRELIVGNPRKYYYNSELLDKCSAFATGIVAHDPAELDAVFAWWQTIATRMDPQLFAGETDKFLMTLPKEKRVMAMVDILQREGRNSQDDPTLQFPKNWLEGDAFNPFGGYGRNPLLDFMGGLSQRNLLHPVAGEIRRRLPQEQENFVLAAVDVFDDSSVANWQRRISPMLVRMSRHDALQVMSFFCEKRSWSSPSGDLQVFLDREKSRNSGVVTAGDQFFSAMASIKLAHEFAKSDYLRERWRQAHDSLAAKDNLLASLKTKDAEQIIQGHLQRALPMVVDALDDDGWNQYLAHLTDYHARESLKITPAILRTGISSGSSQSRARIFPFLRTMLEGLKDKPALDFNVFDYFDLLVTKPPAVDLLELLRPFLDKVASDSYRDKKSFCVQVLDQLEGKPFAVQPLVSAHRVADQSWDVRWTLAGLISGNNENSSPCQESIGTVVSAYNGVFDVDVLAGSTSERLEKILTIENAKGADSQVVTLPPEAKYIGLLARQTNGKVIRWAKPMAIMPDQMVAAKMLCNAQQTQANGIAIAEEDESGYFGIDHATVITLPAGASIELANIPFDPSAGAVLEPSRLCELAVWNPRNSEAKLYLSLRDKDRKEVGKLPLDSKDGFMPIPGWQWLFANVTPALGNAESLVLMAETRAGQLGASTIKVSGILQRVPAAPGAADAGMIKLGRVPCQPTAIAVDAAKQQLAIAGNDGRVCLFDLASRTAGEWVRVSPPAENRSSYDVIASLAMIGEQLFMLERYQSRQSARLKCMDLKTKKITTFGDLSSDPYKEILIDYHFSEDGSYFALKRERDIILYKIEHDKLVQIRQITTNDYRCDCYFNHALKTFEVYTSRFHLELPIEKLASAEAVTKPASKPWSDNDDPERVVERRFPVFCYASNAYIMDHERIANVRINLPAKDFRCRNYKILRKNTDGTNLEMFELAVPAVRICIHPDYTIFGIDAFGNMFQVDLPKVEGYQSK